VIISLAIGIIYMIEGFVFKSDMDGDYSFGSTSSYVPFIFIVLLFILYFASNRFMPLNPLKKKNTSQNSEHNSNENVDSEKENSEKDWSEKDWIEKEGLENLEKEKLNALKQYKKLLDLGIYTQEEFDQKKSTILSEEK
jgi:hypothetical protein